MENEFMEKLFLHIGGILAEISSEGQYKVIQKYINLYGNKESGCKTRIQSNIIINPKDKDVVYQYFYKGLDIIAQGAEPIYLQTEMDYELHRIVLRADIDDLTLRALYLVKRIVVEFHEGKLEGDDFPCLSRYYTSWKVRNKLYDIFKESGLIVEGELEKIYKEECEISEELDIQELVKFDKNFNIEINDEHIKECIYKNIEESRVLITKYKDVIIGTIVFKENSRRAVEGEDLKEILNYEINDMKIDKLYEGKGVAKFLISSVYDRLEEKHGNGVRFNIIEPGVTSIRMKF